MLIPAEVSKLLSECGSLTVSGERALSRESAVRVLQLLKTTRVFVLGGDVVASENGEAFRHTHESWYTDRQPEESLDHYQDRCIQHAQAYISSYPDFPCKQVAFVLVLSELTGSGRAG